PPNLPPARQRVLKPRPLLFLPGVPLFLTNCFCTVLCVAPIPLSYLWGVQALADRPDPPVPRPDAPTPFRLHTPREE
ncbi:hypothetical protein, partial [Acetobacter malorum]|uniref:hypothetical protein n=1 Tax=Acetobacter malorum TaxID=178901 RepID=UPI0039EA2595